MKIAYWIVSLLCCQLLNAQIQIGQDLDGESIYDRFGYAVAYSDDGNIVAIGAPRPIFTSTAEPGPGSVKVYSNNGSEWVLMGEKLEGEFNNVEFGTSVALSSDGLILAVGSPRAPNVEVYNYINGNWVQLGANIEPEVIDNHYFGGAIALSDNGYILSVGASGIAADDDGSSVRGYVRSYEYNLSTGVWEPLGQQLNATDDDTDFGYDVSLSSSGSTLAVIRRRDVSDPNINPQLPSAAIIYEYDGNQWQQIGNEIIGLDDLTEVSLTSDGMNVAIGTWYHNIPNTGTSPSFVSEGAVQVFTFDGLNWVQKGQDIIGNPAEWLGTSISFSNDGTILAVGSMGNDGGSTFEYFDIGSVRIFRFNGTVWEPIGDVIYGESYADRSGNSIALSGDGTRVVIGALENDATTGNVSSRNGHVRVYDIASVVLNVTETQWNTAITAFPNPTKGIISIRSHYDIQSVHVYSILGELLFEQNSNFNSIDLQSYSDGLFLIKIISNKGSVIKNVIKKG